ncbi:Mn(2(+)) exporter [Rhodovastum atsumiense]|uniref:Putative manganese efflux pump MntP n=1 Tax=Rhodovastum atsumiense TaxID=504468 RepID=A0A5M6IXA1_9PROT|nr:manganese efflux pump MntP family protein [Rhodovastum atsumiense]KAA5612922.1 manganese efflux pump [Rhodovastum atsumiense]CAH2600994.1 Mn(2(+)) exporter [Rhodovastum atsumiense]
MSAAAIVALAFSMSMDSFAAALGKGAALNRPCLAEALRTGMIFGAVEAITPILGWTAGLVAAAWVARIDHWAAFIILGLIGGQMVFKALCGKDESAPVPERHSLGVLILTAIATSLDAMAVGITLAFINVDIVSAALAIGLATFLMATLGTLASRWMGPVFGRAAELVGGLCLIAIGTRILIEHTLA